MHPLRCGTPPPSRARYVGSVSSSTGRRSMRRREFITLAGGVVAWPGTMNAQRPSTPIVGFMSSRSTEDTAHLIAAFLQGLRELGFIGGQNVAIEYRWARGNYSRLPAF